MNKFNLVSCFYRIISTMVVLVFITSCESDDEDHTVYYSQNNPNSGSGANYNQSNSGDGYNNNNQNNYSQPQQNNYQQPEVNVQSEAYISLNNQSSVSIIFSVNGDTRVVNPGETSTWSYRSIANLSTTISGNPWSYTWRDGLNHTYVAHNNGINGGFDFN